MYDERNKRIDIGCHFIHEIIPQETVAVTKVATLDNLANILLNQFLVVAVLEIFSRESLRNLN